MVGVHGGANTDDIIVHVESDKDELEERKCGDDDLPLCRLRRKLEF